MKRLILFTAVLLLSTEVCFSQFPNQNTYLLKRLDNYGSGYAACWGYVAPDGREYALLGCNAGTSIVDITDSANIREVDYVPNFSSSWHEMKTYSHYAYIVSEANNSALQIIDLQYLPDSARQVKFWSYSGYTKTHSISQSGSYLYLNGGNSAANGGITVVDVSDPENPVKRGQWTTLYVHDCRILNDTIWASNVYTGKTSVINATNKNSLSTIKTWSSFPVSQISTHNSDITIDRRFILTTNEINGPPSGSMYFYNIEDMDNITFTGSWRPTNINNSIVHNVEIYGNYAVVAHYTAGIRVIDITNPMNPMEVAWYDTYTANDTNSFSGCWGVYKFPSGKIIGSDISNGLYVIKTTISDLNNPPIFINLKAFTEGLYNSSAGKLNRKDEVTVYLRNTTSPYSIMDSAKARIDSLSLQGMFKFSKTPTGNYYIVFKHRNSLETWSRPGGELLEADGPVYSYDFSNSVSKAFGNNLVLSGSRYCIYSGDIDYSNSIDLDDILFINNDGSTFLTGPNLMSDLDGDNAVDLSDITISFNNSNNFVNTKSPLNP
jgi:choice-of-anchor B domain-containing protein